MSFRINTNPASLSAQRLLEGTSKALAKSLERLASGKRVNTAADDASGLAIINGLRAQSSGLARAVRNINDSLGLLASADASISTQIDIIHRMKELVLQASNGTLSSNERGSINLEISELMTEFNRVVNESSYLGTKYLKDGLDDLELQIGPEVDDRLSLNIESSRDQDIFTKDIGTGSFSAPGATYASLSTDMETGDFNEDGHLDIVSNSNAAGELYIQFGAGDGSFGSVTTLDVGSSAEDHKVIDINADGHLDLVISVGSDDVVAIHLGDGLGNFSDPQTYAVQNGGELQIADINSDGNLDIVVGDAIQDNNGTGISVLLGSGSGAFADYEFVDLTYAGGVVKQMRTFDLGDFNEDGDLDIVFYAFSGPAGAPFGTSGPRIALGDGKGGFGNANSIGLGIQITQIDIGDLNGDGHLDVVTGNGVSLGNGDGSFQANVAFDDGVIAMNSRIGDINGDGNLDIVRSSGQVYLGDGTGSFNFESEISITERTGDVVLGDFNADGNLDVLGLSNVDDTFGVHLSILRTVSAVADVQVVDQESSQNLLGILDTALDNLLERRSQIGAVQNRLESARTLSLVNRESIEAAKSQIEDADIAQETAELVMWQIRQQASLSSLTQANLQMQTVLQLLS